MTRVTLGVLALAVPVAASAAPETYTLHPQHTYPNFAVDHLGVATIRGRFDRTSGKFTVDRAAKTGSIELVVDTASISTGDNDKGSRPRSRDEHLRGADFFNVAEFPRMTYKSDGVKFDGEAVVEVTGQLTLLGVTRPLTLKLERWVCRENPIYKKPMCGGDATGVLKRSDFGMKYGLAGIGDEIRLDIGFEGIRD